MVEINKNEKSDKTTLDNTHIRFHWLGRFNHCADMEMICFREKYAIRTDLLNFNDDEIKKIREFIINENNVEKDFMKNCKIATKYFWGQEEEYQSLLTCPKS